ncbi:MAG TPA: SMI1/KNR4 family protein [Gemmataceae bacterium]|nr:SMI1/KNR4 family protein [Gemmataceae bacterium]
MDNNTFVDTEKDISDADLSRVEETFGFSFPSAVRLHCLKYNGGSPQKYLYKAGDTIFVVHEFLPIRYGKDRLEDTIQSLKHDDEILPKHLVPFAVDPGGDYYCFSVRSQDQGTIWFYIGDYHDEPEKAAVYVAESLPEFIQGMTEEE